MKEAIKKDFDLCGMVCEKITEKYGGHTPAYEYSEKERVVPLVVTVTGIIENGGFHYLFESSLPGDPHCRLIIQAFNQIGCTKAAEIIHRAICLFPNCVPQDDDQERIVWFEKQPEELRDRLDSEFWEECDDITISLAKYIREKKLDV